MASYLISICVVLAMSSVEMGGGSTLATRLPPSVNASLEPPTTVGPQSLAPRRNADSVLLDVAEARGEVQQSLIHLAEIMNQVIDERRRRRLSLQKLEAIEDRLTEGTSLEFPDDAVLLEVTETRGEVHQSLNHLTVILNQVLAERRNRRQSLRKLEAIEARLRDGPSCTGNPCLNGGTCSEESTGYSCLCSPGYSSSICQIALRDCSDVKRAEPGSVSGLYTIYPNDTLSARVYCDMDTDRGGWTVFQRRQNGLVNFYRTWKDYAVGFGDLDGEIWLGNRLLHALTKRRDYRLRVDLADWENNTRVAEYDLFVVSSEQDKFRLTVGTYSGTAGDSLSFSSGSQFSTRNGDNDDSSLHCAQQRRGAWWHGVCGHSNLNGRYYSAGRYTSSQSQTGNADGVLWLHWKGSWYSLKTTSMMIRPAL